MKILFEKEVTKDLLEIFDKDIDDDGYIIEKGGSGERVQTLSEEDILAVDFAGIRKGSEIFMKSDLPTIIEVSDQKK